MAFTSFTTAFTVQSLHPYYFYECSVGAHTVSTGPYSTPFIIQTPEDGIIKFTCLVNVL